MNKNYGRWFSHIMIHKKIVYEKFIPCQNIELPFGNVILANKISQPTRIEYYLSSITTNKISYSEYLQMVNFEIKNNRFFGKYLSFKTSNSNCDYCPQLKTLIAYWGSLQHRISYQMVNRRFITHIPPSRNRLRICQLWWKTWECD